MSRLGGIVNVGESKDGRHDKTGGISSALGAGEGEIHLPTAILSGQRDRYVVNAAVLQHKIRTGDEAQGFERKRGGELVTDGDAASSYQRVRLADGGIQRHAVEGDNCAGGR